MAMKETYLTSGSIARRFLHIVLLVNVLVNRLDSVPNILSLRHFDHVVLQNGTVTHNPENQGHPRVVYAAHQ